MYSEESRLHYARLHPLAWLSLSRELSPRTLLHLTQSWNAEFDFPGLRILAPWQTHLLHINNRLPGRLIERYRKVLVPQKPFVTDFAEDLSKLLGFRLIAGRIGPIPPIIKLVNKSDAVIMAIDCFISRGSHLTPLIGATANAHNAAPGQPQTARVWPVFFGKDSEGELERMLQSCPSRRAEQCFSSTSAVTTKDAV